MGLNSNEYKVISIALSICASLFIIIGLIMNSQVKPIIVTKYKIDVSTNKVAEQQAKTNEIIVKDLEIEINTPISTDIKNYLESIDKLSDDTLKYLKLDTSLVNINEAGTYQYTISYKKKKYIGNIKIKEKELPNMNFTLKQLALKTGEALSTNPRTYINEEIPDEVYNALILDISQINNQEQGTYKYYIIYKNIKYQGDITIENSGPKIITPSTEIEEQEQEENNKEETNN